MVGRPMRQCPEGAHVLVLADQCLQRIDTELEVVQPRASRSLPNETVDAEDTQHLAVRVAVVVHLEEGQPHVDRSFGHSHGARRGTRVG